jgi:hypothetical protein
MMVMMVRAVSGFTPYHNAGTSPARTMNAIMEIDDLDILELIVNCV